MTYLSRRVRVHAHLGRGGRHSVGVGRGRRGRGERLLGDRLHGLQVAGVHGDLVLAYVEGEQDELGDELEYLDEAEQAHAEENV